MDRAPVDASESQKRRKKSQEESARADDMEEEELELFSIVQEDLRVKSTVVWQSAVKTLNSALVHIDRHESQVFLDFAFPKIISIMLDQHSSKIGAFEKSCVTQCLTVAVPIIIAQMKTGKQYQMLPVLVMVFNKKKTFYKDLRSSAMIGSYWNKAPGCPEVRAQCIESFCEMKGFHLLLSTLEQLVQNHREGEELDAVIDSEDIRILLQALLEFRASVPDPVCSKICVLIMTYFTKISMAVLKKEQGDAVGAVLAIIRRLVDAGAVESEEVNKLWLEITQRYVESPSLPLRLFGLEQINHIVNCAQASRSFPPRYFVRNAGTEIVNGVYTLKPDATNATYILKRDETGQVFTLFCCTMKSGLKWWFISEADKMQPGSDQDVDYYQHQSQHEEYLPPTHNWVPISKGEAPAPELAADTVLESDEEDTSRLDHMLSAWVTSKKIVEEIFGDRIHREVVSRSALLVKFLAESNKLDAHSIDVIWQSCLQKDQTLVNEIHNLLITTVPFLSIDLLLHLVKSIHGALLQNLQRSEPFPELIAFLQRLATNSPSFLMDRSTEVTTAILELLWSIQMHCSIGNFRLSRSLRDFFQEGLRSEYGEPLRKQFLSECIDGIKRSCSLGSAASPKSNGAEAVSSDATASKSLELLKFLIDSYRLDQGEIVESLNNEHGLVALLFDELAAFVSRSTDKQSSTYRTAIGHRLELIHFVHYKSPNLELSIPQIDRLWKILSSSPAEREFCLVFFNQSSMRSGHQQSSTAVSAHSLALSASISSAFNSDVCSYIFNELICHQTDFHTLGTSGYKCFNTYFVALNTHQKNAEAPLNLLGLDALWQIAFEAPTEVSDLATRELLRVYERYSDDPTTSAADVEVTMNDFLKRVFGQLSTVHECKTESLKLVQHCASLLNGLVASFRRKQSSFVPHGLSGRGPYFSVKLIAQRIPAGNSGGAAAAHQDNSIRTLQTSVYANQPLWLLRRQLEKVVGHPMQQTKILSAGSAVTGDQKTLADLNITEASELRVLMFNTIVQRSAASPIEHNYHHLGLTSPKDVQHPGELIATDSSYFEVLFRVLDIAEGHEVHEVMWEFLKKIPTSVELLNRVAKIGGDASIGNDGDVTMTGPTAEGDESQRASKVEWSTLLRSGASYHEAIYTLQIMDALLLPSDAKKIPFAREYLQRFISGGGFHEVLSYFIGANFHAGSFNEGPAVALRILKFCLFDSEHSDMMLALLSDDDEAPSGHGENGADAAGDTMMDNGTPKSKIVVEHSRYEELVSKIAELVVSEYGRAQEISDRKPTLRILIDALKTVESIVAIAPDAAEKYMGSASLKSLVVAIFLTIESDHVREQWLSSLRSVCRASPSAAQVVYTEFIASIDKIEELAVPCDQYSRMLVFLAQLDGMSESCLALAQRVAQKLRTGFSSKFLACNEHSSEVLIGFLEFLREVIVSHAEIRSNIAREVVDVVYDECLFTLPSEDRHRCPLCVSIETRRPAFKLLASAISSDATILHSLHGRLNRLFTRSEVLLSKWGQENNIKTRGIGEHVGLKNQGSSCYMNSFLQQLFMHPTLRKGLLAAKVTPKPTSSEPTKAEAEQFPERLVGCRIAVECLGGRVYEAQVVGYDSTTRRHTLRYEDGREASFVLAEGRPGNENGRYVILQPELTGIDATLEVLRQVQRAFCYLRDSEMRFYNTKALVDACTCLNLEFSVYQQNDASEFCDKLLDRLETGLKTTPQGTYCLHEALGGKLISQKLPKGCDHRYEREEPFIRLELQIRGKESIEESLAAFVEGEIMDGDNKVECENCGTKKAAIRRTCFGTLPNLLILHLKRFDLDYTTFETVKLNNRCSFPMNLMMKPYTKAGIEELEASTGRENAASPDDEDMESDEASGSDEFMADVNGGGDDDEDETAAVKPDSPRSNSSNSSVGAQHGGDDDTVTPTGAVRSQNGGGVHARKHSIVSKDEHTSTDPNYEYRLKGILVHSGVAQGGHYYSFIYDHVSEKWFKFDDEDVTPFDPANIEAECFGGVQRRSWHGSSNSMEMEVFSNALMLFYEKVIPVDVPKPTDSSTTEAMSDVTSDDERCDYESEVWKSNEVFLQNSYLFDVEFHEFLREMVQSKYMRDASSSSPSSPPPSPALPRPSDADTDVAMVPAPVSGGVSTDESLQGTLAEIGVEFVLSVLLHSREKHGIARWITVLASKFAKHKSICASFFRTLATTKRADWLRGLLFECPDSIARQSFVHLVSRALTAYEAHISAGGKTTNSEDAEVLALLSDALAEFLDQTPVAQQSHLEECFMLIRNCAEISGTMRSLFIKQDMVARLISFFLSERAPTQLKEAFATSHSLSDSSASAAANHRYASPDYQYLLEAIIAILGLPRRVTEPLLAESSAQYPHRVALSEKAEAALTEVYNDFKSEASGLGVAELSKFLRASCSSVGSSSAIEQNARAFLTKYGNRDAENPRVELDGFLTYYTDSAAASTKNVLQDLRAFGFGEDLRRHSRSLPPASAVLADVSALSRSALLSDVFMDSALEEDAETVGDFLLRISIGDAETSEMLTRSLLQCMNGAESGWKGQPVVDVCALALQNLLSYDFSYQQQLIELALLSSEFGLLSTAQSRARFGNGSANLTTATHVALFVYRQLTIVLELHSKVPEVTTWLAEHRSTWEWMYEWLRIESLKPSLGGRLSVLMREPAKTDALMRLGEALGIPYREEERCYIVEGAGYANVNGIYKSTSHTHDSCLTYACVKGDIEYTLFRCCMPSKARRWYISYSPDKNLLGTMSDEDFYFVQSHIDHELPPEDGWKVWVKNEKSQPPVPTVRLYSSTVGANGSRADSDMDLDGASTHGNSAAIHGIDEDFVGVGGDADGDADADTVEYDDSEDEIRVSNERFQAVHLDNQEDGEPSSGTDDFM